MTRFEINCTHVATEPALNSPSSVIVHLGQIDPLLLIRHVRPSIVPHWDGHSTRSSRLLRMRTLLHQKRMRRTGLLGRTRMSRLTSSYRVHCDDLARTRGGFLSARAGFASARSHCQADGEGGGEGVVSGALLRRGGGRAHCNRGDRETGVQFVPRQWI